MTSKMGATLWRLGVFVVVCVLGIFAIFAVFAQFRFQEGRTYNAEFSNASGLKSGQFVRIAGVEVGKVRDVTLNRDATVTVAFTADDTVTLTRGTRAVIRYDDLIGGRYLELQEGPGDVSALPVNGTIPSSQTFPALDLDALIGGFRPLFRALDPDQVNALASQLIQALQGQGPTIGSFLAQTAALTNTLADRDDLIGQVITNLNTVLGSFSEQHQQFDRAVTSLSQLVSTLASRKQDITNSVAYTNAAAGGVADLLTQARPPLTKVVAETDRTSGIVVADKDYLDNVLATLPDTYKTLERLGLYGDYFSFYLCDLVLKVNGKGGQPVFIKIVGQDTGRCTPR